MLAYWAAAKRWPIYPDKKSANTSGGRAQARRDVEPGATMESRKHPGRDFSARYNILSFHDERGVSLPTYALAKGTDLCAAL